MSAFKQMSDQLSGFLDAAEASHEAVCEERDELKARVAELEEVEFLGVLQISSDNWNGEHVLVWHRGVWKCACYEQSEGMWAGWYVVGGHSSRLDPEPVHYRPLPPDLDGDS